MIPHGIPSNPREKVGCDIFNGSHFLLCVDYCSKYHEIAKVDCMKVNHKTPEVDIYSTRNHERTGIGQWPCEEFKQFINEWDFKHLTSSPDYQQSINQYE